MRHGYYPFYKEAPASYPLRLQQVITTILENDLPAVEKVEYVSIKKMKRLLMIVSQMVPSSCFIPKRIICSSLPNGKSSVSCLLLLCRSLQATDKKAIKRIIKAILFFIVSAILL
ncbi:hypothetical protein BACINT_01058 [Bacteroides intestinalis DSM 17393]|uniref:Uncharacterized protein n=1 Tax=Bacteroides intestinalis DSM 17393 TaxID=471870 RepID=B3C994_9BACE|nr:hypothetical protein [Bacteroides intestinalis]EDV05973.1 hypothetical protein BACINT_01058 [Bacteroides intestinalis DSM 17393]